MPVGYSKTGVMPVPEVDFLKQGKVSKSFILTAFIGAAAVICAMAAGIYILKKWQPLRESGSAPFTSKNASSVSPSSQNPQWDGDFTDFLICGIDNTNSLTDVIMLVGFDNSTKKISILQIPRDTYAGADIPSYKYNAVYGHHQKNVSGMETLKARVESDFGVKIGNYAAVTTKGLREIVDAAGGVDLDVPINMNYDDPGQNLHIHLPAGRRHLDGSQAEQFVRYRKGWIQGDLGRLDAQRIFLAAFTNKLRGMNAWKLASKVLPVVKAPDFITDLSAYEMLNLWGSARNVDLKNAAVYLMPGEPYTGKGGAALYSVHKGELLQILNNGFVPKGVKLNPDDLSIIEMRNTEKFYDTKSNFENILNSK